MCAACWLPAGCLLAACWLPAGCCFKGCLLRLWGSVTTPRQDRPPCGSLQEREGRKETGCEHQVGRFASNGHENKKKKKKNTSRRISEGTSTEHTVRLQLLLTRPETCAEVQSSSASSVAAMRLPLLSVVVFGEICCGRSKSTDEFVVNECVLHRRVIHGVMQILC